MLSAEDHPGIFYFLVGMIVLVMTGVGLSLLVDKRLTFSSGKNAIQRDITMGEEELGSLRSYHADRLRQLESSGSKLKNDIATQTGLRQKLSSLSKRQSELENTRSQLTATIPLLETEFSRYRAEYRRQTWAAAVGQKLGTLTIRGGREYQDAVITRVTDVGLEIHHKDGIARVQAPDLDPQWQERFQWSDEERRSRLKEELANHESIAPPPTPEESVVPSSEPIPKGKSQDPTDATKVTELRLKVIAWKTKVSQLTSESAEARSQAGYGGQSSVTGSLETWKAKSARLNGELTRARTELSLAKSRLAVVSPNDSLLHTPVPDNSGY